ncbi:NAD(P)-dependent oxidoreductase, partial [Listeria monocytogenes]
KVEILILFYMPSNPDFGIDLPEHYGTLTYVDDAGVWLEEKVISEVGDYGRVFVDFYEAIIIGKPKQVTVEETLLHME